MIEATYRIPDSVLEDTRAFRGQVEKYLAGETSPVAFRGIRVPMGIYEQRENDTYMVRVRGAAGLFLARQVKVIADLADDYGNGVVHVTTRQDLQIHGVRIEDTPDILDRLLEVGLSSRGGGGNTVRNVSACPHAGACRDEAFDVTPYALALTEYLIRERCNFNLPRKFKVAFSGCGRDCALSSVADLGFFAHERDGAAGFAVYAGGGMGAYSALGVLIEEFIPDGAIFEVAEAVKRLFDRYGDRADRNKARLRFVLQRLGEEAFRRAYRDELENVRLEGISTPGMDRSAIHQRQDGKHAITARLPLGDIPARRLEALAELAVTVGDGSLRTTQEQDIQLRGIDEERLGDAYAALRGMDERFLAPASIRCVACAGASTCKLGLCLSRGLAEALDAELRGIRLSQDAVIRISGCPNSCGQHPIAELGFYGTASRVNGRLVPFYRIVAGGRLGEGTAALAEPVAKIPAKALPAMLKEFWTAAATEFEENEELRELMDRWGTAKLLELAGKYERVPSYDAKPDYYRDFGRIEDFSLAGRGPGECGAGMTDVIALDIDQAKRALHESRLYDAVIASARALLITKGLEPRKDREVFAAFSEHLIAPGWVAGQTRGLLDAAMDLKLGDRDDLNDLRDGIEALVARVEELFHSLDSNLNFRVDPVEESDTDKDNGRSALTELDLRGVACPMNFVRAKIQLEQVEPGEALDILLDGGEPVRNVPASFAEQGQEVLSVEAEQAHYRVRVRRVE